MLLENHYRGLRSFSEGRYRRMVRSENLLDIGRRTVTAPNPDDLWRRAEEEGQAVEVAVLRHDGKVVLGSMTPDSGVVGSLQADLPHMNDRVAQVPREFTQSRREVLIEEQPHAAPGTSKRRSRSAAKARHARMSSRVRSGKSCRISSSVMPDAR